MDLGDVNNTLNDKGGNQLVVATTDPNDQAGTMQIASHYPTRYVSNTLPVVSSSGRIPRVHIVGVADKAKIKEQG
jgi:hypothetical protein